MDSQPLKSIKSPPGSLPAGPPTNIVVNETTETLPSLGATVTENLLTTLHRYPKIQAELATDVEEAQIDGFQKFLEEWIVNIENLTSLKKSSHEYKTQYETLAKSLESRIEELDSSNRIQEAAQSLLSQLLESEFLELEDEIPQEKTILASIILQNAHPIILQTIENFLIAEEDEVAQNFLSTIQSKKLSEDPNIYGTLYAAVIAITETINDPNILRRAIDNLISLSPGTNRSDQAEHLLKLTRRMEEKLVYDYEKLFIQIMDEEDYESDVIVLDEADDFSESQNLLDEMEDQKKEIITTRHFLNHLYRHRSLQGLISGTDVLELLEQENPLNTIAQGNIDAELLISDGEFHLFDANLFQAILHTACTRNDIGRVEIQNKLEAMINHFNQNQDFEPEDKVIDKYCEMFAQQEPNEFLIKLLRDPEPDPVIRNLVVRNLTNTQWYKKLLKEDKGTWSQTATLFGIADQVRVMYKPLQAVLASLNEEEFADCINKVTNIDVGIRDEYSTYITKLGKAQILSIIAKQFTWFEKSDPIYINLLKYLSNNIDDEIYKTLLEQGTRIAEFVRYIQGLPNNNAPYY